MFSVTLFLDVDTMYHNTSVNIHVHMYIKSTTAIPVCI